MVAFGPNTEGGIYLSGYPSYAQPNDLQFVMKAHVSPVPPDYVPKKMNDGLYTMEPDTFSLDRLISGAGAHLPGEPVHRELPGAHQAARPRDARRRRLDDLSAAPPRPDAAPHTPEASYIAFGRIGALYMVHVITGSPDFDQVLYGHVVAGMDDIALEPRRPPW